MTIGRKLMLSFFVVALLIGLLGAYALYRAMDQTEHAAQHESSAVAQTVGVLVGEYVEGNGHTGPRQYQELQEHIMRLKALHQRDIVIVDPQKRVLADAIPEEIGTVFQHDRENEVGLTIADGRIRTFTETSRSYPRGIRQIVLPLNGEGGATIGAVILEYTPLYAEILAKNKKEAFAFLLLFAAALVLSLAIGYFASRSISRPLRAMQDAALRIAAGDLDAAVHHQSRDELGSLAAGFNRMVDGLRTSRADLERAESKFRALFENATDGIFIIDLEGRFLDVNRTGYDRLGYTKDEMLAMSLSHLNSPEFNAQLPERIGRIREQGGAIFESAHRRKDGTLMPVEVNARMLEFDGQTCILSSIREISERKKADEEMRAMNRRLQTLIQAIPDMVLFKDRAGRHLLVNRAAEAMLGRPASEIIGTTEKDLLPPGAAEACRKSDEAVYAARRPVYSEELIPQPDETTRSIDLVKAPIIDERGEPYGLVAIGRDITERKRTEAFLRESEEQYRALVENVNSIVLRWTGEGRIAYMNRFGLQFFGFRRDQLIGRHVVGTIVPETDRSGANLSTMIDSIARDPDRYRNNLNENVCKNGRRVKISWTNRPVMTPAGRVKEILSIGNDVTERLEAEDAHRELLENIVRDRTGELQEKNEQLRREMAERERMETELVKAQKLESLGILAGGIAHDFNNLLTSVLGNVSMALADLEQEQRAYKELARAERATLRAQDLTQQLLTFSRGGAPVKKAASIADLVRETAGFAVRGGHVKCEFDLSADLRLVDIDAGQISQVVHNLIINADHAMPGGGIIAIRGNNVDLPMPGGPPLPPGAYVRITVQDHGIGIHADHLSKVFDPYFTTKQRGSGLGLATSYSIIQKHGGSITVESAPSKGTSFTVYLPASNAASAEEEAATPQPATAAGRVLIMDDEEDLRETAGSMLQRLGYSVAFAGDGGQAVTMYREALEAGNPFAAVILDLTVPGGMSGRESVRLLRELDPAVRTIVSSGYSNDPVIAHYADYGFTGMVAKPYRMKDLGLAVQKVLSGSREREENKKA